MKQKRSRWSEEEDVIMASFELNQPKNVRIKDWIVELKTRHFPERTIEALKLRRKQKAYKSVIARLEKEGDYCNLGLLSEPLGPNESQIFNEVLALSCKGSLNSKKPLVLTPSPLSTTNISERDGVDDLGLYQSANKDQLSEQLVCSALNKVESKEQTDLPTPQFVRRRKGLRSSGRERKKSAWDEHQGNSSGSSFKPPTLEVGCRDLIEAPLEQKIQYIKETVELHMSELNLRELSLEIRPTRAYTPIPTPRGNIFGVGQGPLGGGNGDQCTFIGGFATSSPVEEKDCKECKTPHSIDVESDALLSVKLSAPRSVGLDVGEARSKMLNEEPNLTYREGRSPTMELRNSGSQSGLGSAGGPIHGRRRGGGARGASPDTPLRPAYNLRPRVLVGNREGAMASPPPAPPREGALALEHVILDHGGNFREGVRNELLQLSTELEIPFPTLELLTSQSRIWLPPRNIGRNNEQRERRGRDPPREPALLNNRARNRRLYGICQRAWKRDRKNLTNKIINGIDPSTSLRATPEIEREWCREFEQMSVNENRNPDQITEETYHGLLAPISKVEIIKALRATDGGTAPGWDGVKIKDVMNENMHERLRWMYNSVLWLGDVPVDWKRGRTVLIPKKNIPTRATDFRPITITPLILRIFHRILAQRVSNTVKLPHFQKGFKREEGCASNILLLKNLVETAKSTPSSLYVAFIDFRKAFDSVSHYSIVRACTRLGLPELFIKYITALYQGANTVVGQHQANINSGVLQGDPLSPILFNITLDWVLSELPVAVGANIYGTRIPYLAFADDILLTARSRVGLQVAMDILVRAAARVGLTPGVDKCATLAIVANKKMKTTVIDDRSFNIDGQEVVALQPQSFYKYLGTKMGCQIGDPEEVKVYHLRALDNVCRAPLKPQQKLFMIKNSVQAKYIYPILHTDMGAGYKKHLDKTLRSAVRKLLHLPHDTPTPFFYAPVKAGGLGLTCYATKITALRDELLIRLAKTSPDPVVEGVALRILENENKLEWLETAKGVNSPTSKERAKWIVDLGESVDGKGVKGMEKTPSMRNWVTDGTTLMKGVDYVQGIKLAGGLLETRLRAARGRNVPRQCRHGCHALESLGHIQQTCPFTHGFRVERHDVLVGRVATMLRRRGWRVLKEPRIPTAEGLRKPDLVCSRGDRSIILDGQVCSDAGIATPDEAHTRKVQYYDTQDIKNFVLREHGHIPLLSSVTLSWRGFWANASFNILREMGISKAEIKLLTVRMIEDSVRQYRLFMSGGRLRAAYP